MCDGSTCWGIARLYHFSWPWPNFKVTAASSSWSEKPRSSFPVFALAYCSIVAVCSKRTQSTGVCHFCLATKMTVRCGPFTAVPLARRPFTLGPFIHGPLAPESFALGPSVTGRSLLDHRTVLRQVFRPLSLRYQTFRPWTICTRTIGPQTFRPGPSVTDRFPLDRWDPVCSLTELSLLGRLPTNHSFPRPFASRSFAHAPIPPPPEFSPLERLPMDLSPLDRSPPVHPSIPFRGDSQNPATVCRLCQSVSRGKETVLTSSQHQQHENIVHATAITSLNC